MAAYNLEYNVAMEKMAKAEVAAEETVLPPPSTEKRKNKKSGAFGIFKAALYMMRKRTDEKEANKNKAKSKGSNGDWKKIVESMRPLHVQEAPESPLHMIVDSPRHMMSPVSDCFTAPSPAASSSGTISQYASAANLRELYNSDDEEEEERDPDEVFDAITGDEMIDAKADEFIAQFYRQIQHQNSTTNRNRLGRGV
ncbi:hypothetical protein C2S53_013566 [Perilla frutescens var. hirtella]|uniref:Uncharacterized protein n=1 Tax=Perilla frutescens var. hirtella TaxID=608512 RepID=A0AAD4P2P5_PERFH|nr:hypothetical protein C2S53_013566 [Perilla frutescens var. hirtella]